MLSIIQLTYAPASTIEKSNKCSHPLSAFIKDILLAEANFTWVHWTEFHRSADIFVVSNLHNRMVTAYLTQRDERVTVSYGISAMLNTGMTTMDSTPYHRLFLADAARSFFMDEKFDLDSFASDMELMANFREAMSSILIIVSEFKSEARPRVEKGNWCQYHILEDGKGCESKTDEPGQTTK